MSLGWGSQAGWQGGCAPLSAFVGTRDVRRERSEGDEQRSLDEGRASRVQCVM
jgi:hypothetical protein